MALEFCAKEMSNIAQAINEKQFIKQKERIQKQIIEAAEEGSFSCTFDYMPERICKWLAGLGFKVEKVPTDILRGYWSVEWYEH